MRCLITGASGFLGSHLARNLLQDGHTVTVMLRRESSAWRLQDLRSQLHVVHGEFGELQELEETLQRSPVDVTYHLAWSGVTAAHRNSPEQITRNVSGTLGLWKIVQKSGCRTFIGVGSQAEYGPRSGVLKEDLTPNPATVYGVSKLALSMLLKQLCDLSEMRFVWLRLLSAYGPADDEHHMVPSLVRSLLKGEKPALTAGEQIWDYLYVEDAVSALCAAMKSDASGVYNLGSGKACRLRDFVSMVRDSIDPSLSLGFGEVPYRHDQVMHLEADITLLTAATGWTPKIELSEGIRRTVEWCQAKSNDADRS